jgi:hypothetical protein
MSELHTLRRIEFLRNYYDSVRILKDAYRPIENAFSGIRLKTDTTKTLQRVIHPVNI